MVKVDIKESVLRWAIERSGQSIDELEFKFPISDWLSHKKSPTILQLEAFAKAILLPLGYLFLATPPKEQLPIPHFRTANGKHAPYLSPDLIETVQSMQRRQMWMRDFLIEEGKEPLGFVRSASAKDEPVSVAQKIRDSLGLNAGWARKQKTWTDALRGLRSAMEGLGILVVGNGIVGNNTHRKLNVEEFRGFVLCDEYAPLVFVNMADAKAAQMFTLAHELAHLWLGSSAAFDLRELQAADDKIEQACDKIAAEFLVPTRELRAIWASVKKDPEPFQSIARHFKVSSLVAARRALDAGLIKKDDFFQFYKSYQEDERRVTSKKSEGGDFYATQGSRIGRRFAHTILRAVSEGKLLYNDAYKLTGLYGKTFDRYMASSKIGGTP